MRRLLLLLATVAAGLRAQQATPLAPYTAARVAVMPVQFFKADTAKWSTPPAPAIRAAFDSLLSEALVERGLKEMWATPAAVQRGAKRNAGYVGDPRNLGAHAVRGGVGKDGMIVDPLAGNVRRMVALNDSRYALLPVELRVEPSKEGAGLAVRLMLVDARLNSVIWQADLLGEGAAAYTPALLQKLASRVAELAVAP